MAEACCNEGCQRKVTYEVEITRWSDEFHSVYWYFCEIHWDLARKTMAQGTVSDSWERWDSGDLFPKR